MSAPAPIIRNFKPFEKNTLKGFFDVRLASGMILCGCTLHEKNNRFWIGLPAKPYTTDSGSQSWVKLIDFEDKKTHERFQEIMTPLAVAAYERAKAEAA